MKKKKIDVPIFPGYEIEIDNNDIPKQKIQEKPFKPKPKGRYFYIIPIITILLSILIGVLLFLFNVKLLYKILYFVIAFPFFSLGSLMFLIKVYMDRRKILGKAITTLSKNFIVANFFRENKRIDKVPRLVNDDGLTFNYKKGIYTIDRETIWYDDNNFPNAYYIEGLPNPILFGFDKDIKNFIKKFISDNPRNEGELIDLSFSSKTLQLFKKDKIFAEFSRNPDAEKTSLILMGVVALSIIAIVIIVLVR